MIRRIVEFPDQFTTRFGGPLAVPISGKTTKETRFSQNRVPIGGEKNCRMAEQSTRLKRLARTPSSISPTLNSSATVSAT